MGREPLGTRVDNKLARDPKLLYDEAMASI
jgi:hypothetical protein